MSGGSHVQGKVEVESQKFKSCLVQEKAQDNVAKEAQFQAEKQQQQQKQLQISQAPMKQTNTYPVMSEEIYEAMCSRCKKEGDEDLFYLGDLPPYDDDDDDDDD